jgi:diguanylate cyclase (GGDEF)-like protein
MTPLTKRRILIIDDQDSIHDDYRKIICPARPRQTSLDDVEAELFGAAPEENLDWDIYEIDSAYQGQDAAAMVEQSLREGRPYAVAFVDIRMPPGWDGIKTVRRLWELDPEILVVLCSAYSDYTWDDIDRELGRTDRFLILRKPFDNVEVRQCAAALAERWTVARADALTGLLNRRVFEEHLRREWAHSLRHECPLACVMLDLDFFKSINDNHGHGAGDQTLMAVAGLIEKAARPGDTVCRFGGEEFCVLMPNADEEQAAAWADEVRRQVAASPVCAAHKPIPVTVSGGVPSLNAAAFLQEDLVAQADAALLAAKQAGRNRILRWTELSATEEDDQRVRRYAELFAGLTAGDLMVSPVECLRLEATVGEATELFLQSGFNAAPVTDDEGLLVGILTERDIVEALGVPNGWSNAVREVMTPRVIQYEPSTPADVIFKFLCRVKLRRVVIADQGRPVGMVSCNSFLRWFCDSHDKQLTCNS